MAYTHNYIPYNCDIILTHQAYALTYQFHITLAIHFKNISINYETNTPNSSYTVTDCPNGLQKFSKILTIRSQVLGQIKRPFKASNQPTHYKTLKQSVTSSRIKPLPHGVCRNSNFLESTRSSHRVDQLCLQSRRKPAVRFS